MSDRVAVPKIMRIRPRDARGYPIPYIVLMDINRQPIFTVNDQRRVHDCITKRLCSICGKKLSKDVWFVGGSRCFLHDHGAFIDPPVHYECGEYALRVCPFLAAPSYSKSIAHQQVAKASLPSNAMHMEIPFMGPLRPERFGIGTPTMFSLTREGVFKADGWTFIEWWRNGKKCDAPTASEFIELSTTEGDR